MSVLLVTADGPIAEVRLNRPAVRNAVDDELRDELTRTFEALNDDERVRAVIVTGEGTAFCAGGDISAMQQRLETPPGQVAARGWKRIRHTERLVTTLRDLGQVTIAAVNGPAAGFGMDLALACDFVVAADTAFFAMSYVLRGLVPDGGGLYTLPRRVGLTRAKELVFSGRRVDAAEALALGIADRVVPATELMAAARSWAEELVQGLPTAVALSKAILNRTFELGPREVFALSAEAMALCYTSEEHQASVAEFLRARSRRA